MKWPYNYQIQSIGADPEVFLVDKNGKPISAEGKIGGSKLAPIPMVGLGAGFMVQEDNVAAEYNIPPASSRTQFSGNILAGLKYIERISKPHGLKVVCSSALHFDWDQLNTPHALELGCAPDYNVWTQENNPRPRPPNSLRTAAGHVHISWKEPTADAAIVFGKALDVFLGLPSLLVTKPNDRRKLYGRAGAVRIKDYGVEYRVLDNFWLVHKAQCGFIFDTCHEVAQLLNEKQEYLEDELNLYEIPIQQAINDHNLDMGLKLMNHFDVSPFPD